MRLDDNSVNIGRAYHHGDLRAAVIAAALQRIEAGEGDALSLREVARDVAVSPTAIYRHFPNKDALLDALAHDGAELLGREQQAASEAAGGGVAGFNACGRAYVRFALAHPALFRLIGARLHLADPLHADPARLSTALRFLRESVDGLLPKGAPMATRTRVALHAWSLVHGLALLMLDGQVPRDPALIDVVVDAKGIVGSR